MEKKTENGNNKFPKKYYLKINKRKINNPK
jgi:hypothetical protein